jgi:hypothetical protein
MKLLDIITAADGRVSGGDPYLWRCFGENAQFLEFRDVDGNGYCHCIFDTKTFNVYQIHVEVPLLSNEADSPEQVFQWTDSNFKDAYYSECKKNGIVPNIAWDAITYTTIDSDELILEYVRDIGSTYYDNLPIPTSSPMILDMPGTIGGAKLVFSDSEPNSAK